MDVVHPTLDGIHGVTHVQFIGPPRRTDATNICSAVIRPGGADRSPCGTGTAARTAALVARVRLRMGEPLAHESITGRAYVTGTAEWTIDPHDPLRAGFLFT